jgi:hypothetical protein
LRNISVENFRIHGPVIFFFVAIIERKQHYFFGLKVTIVETVISMIQNILKGYSFLELTVI